MVHEGLEGWWGIAETEKHDCRFIEAKGSNEHSLPLIFLSNVNVVITPSYIKIGKEGGILHVINQLRNKWERVSIVDSVAVKVAIILARMESSILFQNKEERSSLWGFGRYNTSGLQVFINESLASFLFGRVKRIDLGNLGDEGVLEFDGVIKRLMRRENVISLFRKDISGISAKVGDWDLFGFVCLGQLGRNCDLIDLFHRSTCPKVILMKRPVIFSRGNRREQLRVFMIYIEVKVARMIGNMETGG